MAIYEILQEIMEDRDLSVADTARICDLPDSTVRGIIRRKQDTVALEVAFKLAKGLNVSLERLNGLPEKISAINNTSLSDEALSVARDYNNLDKWGKRVVQSVISDEQARMAAEAAQAEAQPPVPVTKIIPLLGNSFAAGKGDPDFGNMWEDYEVSLDSPAEFAIRINGDSMEPYLEDNSIAYGKKRTPKDGEVAALLVDGEFLVKQVCEDHLGNLYLFALNRERKDADVTIWNDSGRSVLCFGTIIMPREVPLPFK